MSLTNAIPVQVKNAEADTIPPRSFVRLGEFTEVGDGTWIAEALKPSDDTEVIYAISGRVPILGTDDIAGGGTAACYLAWAPMWVKYAADDVPEIGSECGPEDDSWELSTEGSGFRCLGKKTEDLLALVILVPAGGAGEIILFEIDSVNEGDPCLSVEAYVLDETCGKAEIVDPVTVWDEAGYYFNIPPADLVGLKGFARKMKGRDLPDWEEGDECVWVVISLGCFELAPFEEAPSE